MQHVAERNAQRDGRKKAERTPAPIQRIDSIATLINSGIGADSFSDLLITWFLFRFLLNFSSIDLRNSLDYVKKFVPEHTRIPSIPMSSSSAQALNFILIVSMGP